MLPCCKIATMERRKKRISRGYHPSQSLAAHPGGTANFDAAQTREAAPEEVFDSIWLQEHLWHCLRELRDEVEPATYRAFLAYVVEQQPVEQVCAASGLTAQNVYTIKWRLTERVAAKMRELVDGAE